MDMRIQEFARKTNVSVRTLHYYDEIGLLKPSKVDGETGYRYYDEQCFLRMQEILFYRELDFSLDNIRQILSAPEHDMRTSLEAQKKLLTLKKERLERLILSIDRAMEGENVMTAFDNSAFEQYKEEARQKWGHTDAYRQYEQKTKGHSKDAWDNLARGMDGVMADFAACMQAGHAPASPEAQHMVKQLQNYITAHFYPCTDEILMGLGQMYVMDERFTANIDKHGAGTAAYIARAIEVYETD